MLSGLAYLFMSSLNLSGFLREIPLPDIVRLLHTTRRTGRLVISQDNLAGAIFFQEGKIIDGQSGQLSGLDAIRHLALFTRGVFEFFDNETGRVGTLGAVATEDMILALETRILEAIQIQELMPQDQEIPHYLGGAIPNDFEVNAAELAVAMKSSAGMLSTTALSFELGLDLMAVRYTVARFRAIGLMELKPEAPEVTAPPVEPEPAAPPVNSAQPRYWRGRRIE